MLCLEEMGYEIRSLQFHSITDNKVHKIRKPTVDDMLNFEHFLEKYRKFDILSKNWTQNTEKCRRCIYRELCDYYVGEIYPQMSLFDELKI
jgi:CRISPR-associated protein Cas4